MRREHVSLQPKQRELQDMTFRDLISEGAVYSCSYVLTYLRTRAFALQKVELRHSPRLLISHIHSTKVKTSPYLHATI